MGKCKPQNEMNSSEDDTEKQQNCIHSARAETPQKYFLLLGELNGQKNEASLLGRPVEVSKHIAQYLLLCYSGTIFSKQPGNSLTSSNEEESHQTQHEENLSAQATMKPLGVPVPAGKKSNIPVARNANNNNNTNNLKNSLARKAVERCNPHKKFKPSVSASSTPNPNPNDGGGHGIVNVRRHDDRFVNGRALALSSHKNKNRKNSHSGVSPRRASDSSPNSIPRKVSHERKNRRRMRSKSNSNSNSRSAKREKLSKMSPLRRRSASASQKKSQSQTPTFSTVRTRSKSKQETKNVLAKSKEKKTDVPPPNRRATLGFDKPLVKTDNDNDESIKFASDIDDDDSSDDEERGLAEKEIGEPRKISNIYAKKGEKLDESDLARSRTFSNASGSNTSKTCECHCRNCRFGSIQNKK